MIKINKICKFLSTLTRPQIGRPATCVHWEGLFLLKPYSLYISNASGSPNEHQAIKLALRPTLSDTKGMHGKCFSRKMNNSFRGVTSNKGYLIEEIFYAYRNTSERTRHLKRVQSARFAQSK